MTPSSAHSRGGNVGEKLRVLKFAYLSNWEDTIPQAVSDLRRFAYRRIHQVDGQRIHSLQTSLKELLLQSFLVLFRSCLLVSCRPPTATHEKRQGFHSQPTETLVCDASFGRAHRGLGASPPWCWWWWIQKTRR